MDPIADMFSQIYNAQQAGVEKVVIEFSKMKMAILEILKKAGKITDYHESQEKGFATIEIKLASSQKWQAKKISKPGRRVYASNGKIPRPKTYKGLIIVSTPEGIMAGEEGREKSNGAGCISGEV